MDVIPKNKILQMKPNTLELVRKEYNLDKPGRMREAVDILHAWVQKQPHFKKKDFSDLYYQFTIITCKGSIERAKNQLDKICTLRTLVPQFFGNINFKKDVGNLFDILNIIMLPKLTEENNRVVIYKIYNLLPKSSQFLDIYRTTMVLAEYIKGHDIMSGCIVIIDYSETNVMDLVSKINLIEFRQACSIITEGYGLRLKGIYIISSSKFLDLIITIAKQILSPKLVSRIHFLQSTDEIQKFIPKEVLPIEYGGEERSIKDLQAEWIEEFSSEEHLNYIRDMNTASTDETYRQTEKFNEQCAGLPGTFRLLRLD